MKLIRTASEMSLWSKSKESSSIGFVPTMGALHEGHLSLVRRSLSENDQTVVSIFVNPTQFNESADFDKYPRQHDKDIALLKGVGCDCVFIPSVNEIYPSPDGHQYDLGEVANVMEGKHRPGHFNGVASVVKRLFEITHPKRAYFGLKDYQQFLIIQKLVENYRIDIDVVGCAIVRDKDGLALSSRNARLSSEQRSTALELSAALKEMVAHAEIQDNAALEKIGLDYLKKNPQVEVEYLNVANAIDLSTGSKNGGNGQRIALLAARVGEVRLIDNMWV